MERVKRAAILFLVVLSLFGAVPAARADNVEVKFGISAGYWLPTGAACTVSVPAGASGVAVLDAALANLCIAEYSLRYFTCCGNFVYSINFVPGPVDGDPLGTTFWMMFENGAATGYGVDGFSADPGDELVFAYAAWPPCLVVPPLCGG